MTMDAIRRRPQIMSDWDRLDELAHEALTRAENDWISDFMARLEGMIGIVGRKMK